MTPLLPTAMARGFTLVELMIAITVFAFLFVPLLSLFSSNIDAFRAAREYVTIIHITEGQIHKFTNIINNLAADETVSFINEDLTPEINSDYPNGLGWLSDLRVTGTVTLAAATEGTGSYQVLIKATWGHNHNYSISSIIPVRSLVANAETIERPQVAMPSSGRATRSPRDRRGRR